MNKEERRKYIINWRKRKLIENPDYDNLCYKRRMQKNSNYFNDKWKQDEKYRIRSKKYRQSHLDLYKKSQKKYYKNNPKKVIAHRLAKKNKENFIMCSNCGSKSNLHRHHPDYNYPNSFIVLCSYCHKNLHHKSRGGK